MNNQASAIKQRSIHKFISEDEHLCGDLGFDKEKICCSPEWKKVTCKKCLKLKERNCMKAKKNKKKKMTKKTSKKKSKK